MTELNALFARYNFEKRITPAENIQLIQREIGFPLPADYLYYVLNYKRFEGFIGLEYVVLWDVAELLQLNKDYEILSSFSETIAIGSNGSGEFIGIEFNNQQYRIVISPFIGLDSADHIHIGDSFSDTLCRLEKGKAWFE
ncbi:SMI1/KNR4 family protein [Mucilaginibacter psychrotolerans]|uniref:SMI1/KNR4 family protein n=1 Tax=Mucilaginibacter psychrotolerans TaxID=1524096 RepID=A0A4Y8SQT7_9SPHI|nr:SMI1/KNR4 family protein [Mucilaginibacter psychrotolerans]TFF40774.1 SMI1/KNR4 family protein [Mucilaginibacter psychrotolerans]